MKTFLGVPKALRRTDTAPAVGGLETIGPPTPEQISVFLPVSDSVPYTATAACEYKRSADSLWTPGHPLYRIRNDISSGAYGDTLLHGFAWPIIGLLQGTSYDVHVTMTDGAAVTHHYLTTSTRALPAAAIPYNKTANSDATIRSQIAGLVAGDVLQIADGNYTLAAGYISVSGRVGTAAQPIVIRGQSRTGTILHRTSAEIIFLIGNSAHVIFENMTVLGNGINNQGVVGVDNPGAPAFHIGGVAWSSSYVTVRNCIVDDVDRFFWADNRQTALLVYNNTVQGNNVWVPNAQGPGTQDNWGDDGVHFPGMGNCAFQNTISGFGDTFAYCSGQNQGAQVASACHVYRNEIRYSCDDSLEVDDAEACCTFYDNRITNGVNCVSLDALNGGPFLMARNIFLNLYRSRPFKWNSQNSGQFIYNNTIHGPQSSRVANYDDQGHWYQPNNGAQVSYGYRNNVFVIADTSQPYLLKFAGYGANHSILDWTHNSWYPDSPVVIDAIGNWASMTAAIAADVNRPPVFSGQTQVFYQDNITTASPWVTPIPLPATGRIELLGDHLPIPAAGSAMKNTGVHIPNITDGFTGAAPDRGAVVEGRSLVAYGDQTGAAAFVPTWVPSTPWAWTNVPAPASKTDSAWLSTIYGGGTDALGYVLPSGSGAMYGSYGACWDYSAPCYSALHHEIWMFGGGHQGTTINIVTKWRLNQDIPDIVVTSTETDRAYQATCATGQPNGTLYMSQPQFAVDNKPYAAHTYFNNFYSDYSDEFFTVVSGTCGGLPGSWSGSGPDMSDHVVMRRDGTWHPRNYYQTTLHNIGFTSPSVILGPHFLSLDGKKLYYWVQGFGLQYLDIVTRLQVDVGGAYYPPSGGDRRFAIESTTRAMYIVATGGGGWVGGFVNLTTNAHTPITSFTGDALVAGYSIFDLVWCSDKGYYVALLMDRSPGPDAGPTLSSWVIATITPGAVNTAAVSVKTMTGTVPTGVAHTPFRGAFYDPAYGAVIVACNHTLPLKVFKVA